jgi:hypothetical protein
MCSTKFDDVLYIPTKFKLFMSNAVVRNSENRNEKNMFHKFTLIQISYSKFF